MKEYPDVMQWFEQQFQMIRAEVKVLQTRIEVVYVDLELLRKQLKQLKVL